jgi:enoyl-CoA hydratase
MGDYTYVTYEEIDDARIVRILLNRPEARNAQNRGMLVDLDAAFREAEADDSAASGRSSPRGTTWVPR